MAFPLDYTGEVSCNSLLISNVELFQNRFMQKVIEKLEKAQASIVIKDNEIAFRTARTVTAMFNMDSALISNVPKGKFILNPDKGTITYFLDFKRTILLLTLWIFIFLGSLFVFGMNGSLVLKIGIVILVWLIMIVVSFFAAVSRFKRFINRSLSEIGINPM